MTTATSLFQEGRLAEAIEEQTALVRQEPADPAKRMFLFELLAFAGDNDRAAKQIEAIQLDDMGKQAALGRYRRLLDCEQKRQQLYSAGTPPKFLAEPPAGVASRLQALTLVREGKTDEAAKLLAAADDQLPLLKGTLNGSDFEGLRDGDDFVAAVLEVFVDGDYYWAPLEQIERVSAEAPKYPRDLLWMEAQIELRAGGQSNVFLPLLYAGSATHAQPAVKLGRATEWEGPENGPQRGLGLKLFLAGEDASPLREWRELCID